ncbi:hypothetical protein [Wenxinia saemankumensis]|uniref:Uncharacterized protein n=1 Tax=Wenxinia saemankumensis TaxID=1447782 RepID=A0A1M6A5A2_9RHOB|nr:hypothetical protein [Wenxinia saemankumensis]SHI31666.1 hypothetical protein SAMN05444417_0236 [Wenxinia saemankumensis]
MSTPCRGVPAASPTGPPILLIADRPGVSAPGLTRAVRGLEASLGAGPFAVRSARSLDVATLQKLAPRVVLARLSGDALDAAEIAALLEAAGFTGQFFAVATGIGHAGMIADEIRARHPGFAFEILKAGR